MSQVDDVSLKFEFLNNCQGNLPSKVTPSEQADYLLQNLWFYYTLMEGTRDDHQSLSFNRVFFGKK